MCSLECSLASRGLSATAEPLYSVVRLDSLWRRQIICGRGLTSIRLLTISQSSRHSSASTTTATGLVCTYWLFLGDPAFWILLSNGEYADETDRQTDRRTDGRHAVTLRFPLDAASVMKMSLKVPPHLKHVITLPCEILDILLIDNSQLFDFLRHPCTPLSSSSSSS